MAAQHETDIFIPLTDITVGVTHIKMSAIAADGSESKIAECPVDIYRQIIVDYISSITRRERSKANYAKIKPKLVEARLARKIADIEKLKQEFEQLKAE